MSAPNSSNLICVVMIAMLAALLPSQARATLACTANPSIANLTATIPSAPITTVGSPSSRYLTDWFNAPVSGVTRIYDGCTSNNTSNISLEGRVTLPPTGATIDGYQIFATGVRGVGVIVRGNDKNASAPLGSGWTRIIRGWSTFWDGGFGARLVSTGDTIATGTVSVGKVGEIRLAEDGVTNPIVPLNLIASGSVNITSRTCSVSTGSQTIAIPMGAIGRSAFSGVGSTAGGTSFIVHLENCSTGLNLFMTFTDGNSPANTSDVLTITPGAGSATGIGIRIGRQDNLQRVSYGTDSALPGSPGQMSFGATTGTTRSLAFTAAYVQTQASIVSGTANAIATFTMSYQ